MCNNDATEGLIKTKTLRRTPQNTVALTNKHSDLENLINDVEKEILCYYTETAFLARNVRGLWAFLSVSDYKPLMSAKYWSF